MRILSDQVAMHASHRVTQERHTEVAVNREWQTIFDLHGPGADVQADDQNSQDDNSGGSTARTALQTHITRMELQMMGVLQSLQTIYTGDLEPIMISGDIADSQSLVDRLMAAFDERDVFGGMRGFSFSGARMSMTSMSAGNLGAAGTVLTTNTMYRETFVHSETTSFYANGQVNLADGRSLDFNLSMAMERERVEETSFFESQSVFLLDPLVLSLDGSPPELTDMTFSFDLDGNEEDENIPRLAGGAGYLVFDRNHDGMVNTGLELFGPQSGNGFSELSLWDSDDNSWIDENDPIFNDLSIWTWDPDTGDQLQGLSEAGIGAIHLAALDTPFDQLGEDGTLLGQTRQTGIFLEEATGTAGIIQQLDLNRFMS